MLEMQGNTPENKILPTYLKMVIMYLAFSVPSTVVTLTLPVQVS